jgi:NAD(P)-dependent dehydrogenase (short-subunit alcohol dehydrogenase family)
MALVLVTGSTTGLGFGAAQALLDAGHRVVLHARNTRRAADLGSLAARAAGVAIGDLATLSETRRVAEQVNAVGKLDAVIHNAALPAEPERIETTDGHPQVVAVNLLAPYLLTVLIRRPSRLVYVSSGLHASGRASLDDIDWTTRPWSGRQAYSDSKLLVTVLAAAVARRWPGVRSNAVDPGWVPTRMGGPGASDDLTLGHETQVWLATSDDPAAAASGKYWYHQQIRNAAAAVSDHTFQDQLLQRLTTITGEALPNSRVGP